MRAIKKIVRRALKSMGYEVRRRAAVEDAKYPPDFPPRIVETVEAVRPFTMTTPERIFSLIEATEYVVRHDIPGAFVECGVWKGGSMMAVAHTLLRLGRTDRELYLFDTYEGMPPPGEVDRDFRGDTAGHLMSVKDRDTSWVWAVAQLDEVRANLERSGYPVERIRYVRGKVEDTVPDEAPARIALLRLDTDWYESTAHEMEHLFPRLVPGGVLIVDDYGHWEGARRAIDEYIRRERVPLLLCRIDYSGRIALKQYSADGEISGGASPPLDRNHTPL